MNEVIKLIYLTAGVSASGALSPGPLTLATIAMGSKNGWRSGLMMAIGHTLVEVPYVTILFYFFTYTKVILQGAIGDVITLMGGLIVLYFASLTIRDGVRCLGGFVKLGTNAYYGMKNPILIGALFTGLNVWFLLWWLSIGLEIISLAMKLGTLGLTLVFASHLWLDYMWLILVAETSRRGTLIMGSRGHSVLMIVLGSILALFGVNMVLRRLTSFSLLP
ncbi:MAG: LysE family transporter [Desulfurococcaceae archaeon]